MAGAIGNMIDSAFYGLLFDRNRLQHEMNGWDSYYGVSQAKF